MIKHLRQSFCAAGIAASCVLAAALPQAAVASLITFDYKTTLGLSSGTDTAGLAGATIELKVDVDSASKYVSRFGVPAVVMNNDATFTIAGSSKAANNGTFALSLLAFYPTFAGLFTEPAGLNPVFTLPVGGAFTVNFATTRTAHGASAAVGNFVDPLDFGAVTGTSTFSTASASYAQLNATTTVTGGTRAIPEPESIALLAIGAAGLVGFGRRRRVAVA